MNTYFDRCCALARINCDNSIRLKTLRREIRLIQAGAHSIQNGLNYDVDQRRKYARRAILIITKSDETALITKLKLLKFQPISDIKRRRIYEQVEPHYLIMWLLKW